MMIRTKDKVCDSKKLENVIFNKVKNANIDSNVSYESEETYNYLRSLANISYYHELTAHGRFKKIKIFFKRIIRKLCRFIAEPILNEEKELHENTILEIEKLNKRIELLENENRRFRTNKKI